MNDGGFNLSKWMSNSRELMDQINKCEDTTTVCEKSTKEEDETYTDHLLSTQESVAEDSEQKILGVIGTSKKTL